MIALVVALSVPMQPRTWQWSTLEDGNQNKCNQVGHIESNHKVCYHAESFVGKDSKVEAADRDLGHGQDAEVNQFVPEVYLKHGKY